MNRMSNRHLTEDQMDDVLIGDLAAEAGAHLEQCADCQMRVETARAPIASFAAVSMAWSERRSATAPVTLVQVVISGQRRANWVAATTAALLVAVSIPLTMREKRTEVVASDVAPQAMTVQGQTAPRAGLMKQARIQPVAVHHDHPAAEIAHDNEMLQAIDREMDAAVQAPSDNFGLMAVGGTPAARERYAPVQTWD